MKRPYLISFLILSSSLIISCSNASTSSIENKKEDKTYIVRFISNIPNVKITLSSKYEALADSILFESQEVKENEKVAIPNSEPIRNSYFFKGWYTNSTCTIQYDFESLVTSNINLYAKWERDNSTIIDDFVEPSITFKEIIDDNIIHVKRSKKEVAELVKEIVQKGIDVYQVKLVEASLEEAFLKETGGNIID